MLALLSRKWCYLMMVVEGVLPPSPPMMTPRLLLLLLLVPPHFSLVPFLLLLGAIPLIHLLLLSLLVVAVPLIAVAWWHTLVQFEHRNWLGALRKCLAQARTHLFKSPSMARKTYFNSCVTLSMELSRLLSSMYYLIT